MNDEQIINKFNQSKNYVTRQVNSFLISQAKSKLEKDLAKIIIIANNHLNKGKLKGDPVFNSLRFQAYTKITEFCNYSTEKGMVIHTSDIEEQIPALVDLNECTIADKKISTLSKFVIVLCLSPVFLGLIGLSAGIISLVYHFIAH